MRSLGAMIRGGRQRGAQDKGREVETFISGSGSENALLFTRRSQLDSIRPRW
jgi:hypothetical protein